MSSNTITRNDLKNILNKILPSPKVLEKTVTGTTNAYGAINLSLPWTTSEIVSITSSSNTQYCISFSIGASTYARVLNDAATYSIAANTSVTLTVRYRTYTL